jgi:hypothetical protein
MSKKHHKKEAHHAHSDAHHKRDVAGNDHGRNSGDTDGKEDHKMSGGSLFHDGMVAYPHGLGSDDPMAHSSHHEANRAHGTPQGTSPRGEGSDGKGGSSEGGEGMEGNAHYC